MLNRHLSVLISGICLLLLGTSFLSAQQVTEEEDVLYLKNGSVIRGEITERMIGESIKVQVLGGSVFVFDESEVETILKSPKVYSPPSAAPISRREYKRGFKQNTPVTRRQRGIYNMFSFGFQPGPDTWNSVVPWVTLQWRTGYSFNQYINIGGGIGIDSYMPGGMIPVYADFHGELGKTVRPMMFHYFAQAGYGINAWTNNWRFGALEGGPMGHLGAGWKLNTRRRVEWLFTLGYKFQSMRFFEIDWGGWGNPFPEPSESPVRRVFRPITLQVAVGF